MQTDEQTVLSRAIAANQPISGRACAGTGKTTTAVAGLQDTKARALALAFNKSAAQNLQARLSNPLVEAKTLNSLGHRLVGQFTGKRLMLSENKIFALTKQHFEAVGAEREAQESIAPVMALVREARIAGLVPESASQALTGLLQDTPENWAELGDEEPSAEQVAAARKILAKSCQQALAGTIDFDDQIYIAALNPNKISGYQQIVVDEAQDLNPLQHKMLQKFIGARLQIIGDPRQSIYGFRGAVSSSMERLEERFGLSVAPLTLCFRCDQEIIRAAQRWCPEIRAASANAGIVDELAEWQPQRLDSKAAILCRNNAPLLKIAFQLLRAGLRPNFVGRDIGKNLTRTIEKALGKGQDSRSIADTTRLISQRLGQELAVLEAANKTSRAEALRDRLECILAMLETTEASTASGFLLQVKDFFARPGAGLTLSSIHRAKGLEWPRVYWLDSHLGGRRGQTDEQAQQEANLKYVAATRAQHHLTFINSEEI